MIKSKPMPLRTRLAAVHGDADQAAEQLDKMARSFHLDIARLLANENQAPTRRGLRFGLGRPGLQPSPGIVAVPAPTA